MPKSHKSPYVTAKEIYAAYGEALSFAQSMETGMRIFYLLDKALPKAPPGKLPRLNFDDETPPDLNINSLGGFIFQFRKEMMEEGTVDIADARHHAQPGTGSGRPQLAGALLLVGTFGGNFLSPGAGPDAGGVAGVDR